MSNGSEDRSTLDRREKLNTLRTIGDAYPNDFRRSHFSSELHQLYDSLSKAELEANPPAPVSVAGRVMGRREMGKSIFMHLQDMNGRVQLYFHKKKLGDNVFTAIKGWDLGDIVGIEGVVFKTKTGETTVSVTTARLLTKSLRPMPEKYRGLSDIETVYRQRYLDLLSNSESRKRFLARCDIITAIRHFFLERDFSEVETPMMQALAGGAMAKPFVTHHNALDLDLYLRIAPELYLKRLIVGGLERVFELNRNFRNEGISSFHNPEFTMLEFYQAYANYHDLMDMIEDLCRHIATTLHDDTCLVYQGREYDFKAPYPRWSMSEAIAKFHPEICEQDLRDRDVLAQLARKYNIVLDASYGIGKMQLEIFEKRVEPKLLGPIFITHYPVEVSPLARKDTDDPFVTERFEFFVAGREIANGFSELNDPEDQEKRFLEQIDKEDSPHNIIDNDYVKALEYGMPPTAGAGIGIDRLTMLMTDASSIRDVILFPLLRPLV